MHEIQWLWLMLWRLKLKRNTLLPLIQRDWSLTHGQECQSIFLWSWPWSIQCGTSSPKELTRRGKQGCWVRAVHHLFYYSLHSIISFHLSLPYFLPPPPPHPSHTYHRNDFRCLCAPAPSLFWICPPLLLPFSSSLQLRIKHSLYCPAVWGREVSH